MTPRPCLPCLNRWRYSRAMLQHPAGAAVMAHAFLTKRPLLRAAPEKAPTEAAQMNGTEKQVWTLSLHNHAAMPQSQRWGQR